MFNTLETFDTEFSADSVEWCPARSFEDIFVCGTYQLLDEGINKQRAGRIYLFKVIKTEKLQLQLLQKLDVAAVLDMKWAHIKTEENKILLGVVNSVGFLRIYELRTEDEDVCLGFISEILVNNLPNTLALSLDWSSGLKINSGLQISVSDSQGCVSLYKIGNNGDIEKINSWKGHSFEAWITAFDYWDINTIYSGGDDCKFLRYDTRIESDSPVSKNSSHTAGVTSLHSNWKKEFNLVSGSYDEILRLWDLRKLKHPLAELNLQGGIWRLKWDPFEAKYLLAACMYNGFCLINFDNFENPEIIAEYKEHESIAYGCDWSLVQRKADSPKSQLLNDEHSVLIGTCSFYDHTLKLSEVALNELKS